MTIRISIPSASTERPVTNLNITRSQRHLVATAMAITKHMRQAGESEIDDAARAFIIIAGAGLDEVMSPFLNRDSDVDPEDQEVAFMEWTEELSSYFPQVEHFRDPESNHAC